MSSLICDRCGAVEWDIENGFRKCKYCGALTPLTNGDYNNQNNYDKTIERLPSEDHEIFWTVFGWEKLKVFNYANGDVRITFIRNKSDENYNVWVSNEQLWNTVRQLYTCLSKLSYGVQYLKVTYEEIEKQPEYQLKGLRAYFHLRKKEQVAEIAKNVKEINDGYEDFRKKLQPDYDYVYELKNGGFFKSLLISKNIKHLERDKIISIIDKYNIKMDADGNLEMNISGIKYNFKTHAVELV